MADKMYSVPVDGPDVPPTEQDLATSRSEGRAAGLTAFRADARDQEANVHAGRKVPHKLAHARAGGRDSRKNQSEQNDSRAKRALSQHSKPLPYLNPIGRSGSFPRPLKGK